MYTQGKNNSIKRLFFILPVLLLVPFLVLFDSLIYFITRPSCLNCGNLIEFLKGASLTVFMLGNIGYQLKSRKNVKQ